MLETFPEEVAAWRDRLVDRAATRREVWHRDPAPARVAADEAVGRLLPDSSLLRLRSGPRELGWCWLGSEGADLVLLDLELGSVADAEAVRDWLVTRARDSGLAGLRASATPADPVARRLVDDPLFALLSTNMLLELKGAPSSVVRLEPMTEEGFAAYLERSVREYAAERHAAGEPLEEAERIAVEQTAQLLPEGRNSPGQHLFAAYADADEVGLLWLSTTTPVAFVYDVEIHEDRRGRGLGRDLMNAAAVWSLERGAPALGLNVFSHNDRARALYDRLGYRVVEDHYRATLG